jgi:hypothetical protein
MGDLILTKEPNDTSLTFGQNTAKTINKNDLILTKGPGANIEPVKIPDEITDKIGRITYNAGTGSLEGTLAPSAYRMLRNTIGAKLPEWVPGKWKGSNQDIIRQMVADSIGTLILAGSAYTGTYPALLKAGAATGGILGATGAGEKISKLTNDISAKLVKKLNIKEDTPQETVLKIMSDNIPMIASHTVGGLTLALNKGKPIGRGLSPTGELAKQKEIPFTKSAEKIERFKEKTLKTSQKDLIYPKNLEGIIKSKNPELYAKFKETQNKALLRTFDDIIGEDLTKKSAFDVGLEAKKTWDNYENGVKQNFDESIKRLNPAKVYVPKEVPQIYNLLFRIKSRRAGVPRTENGKGLIDIKSMTMGEKWSKPFAEMMSELEQSLPKMDTLDKLINLKRNFADEKLGTLSQKYPSARLEMLEKQAYNDIRDYINSTIEKNIKQGKLDANLGNKYREINDNYSNYLEKKLELRDIVSASPERIYDKIRTKGTKYEKIFADIPGGQEALQNMALNKLEYDVIKGDRLETGK